MDPGVQPRGPCSAVTVMVSHSDGREGSGPCEMLVTAAKEHCSELVSAQKSKFSSENDTGNERR